MLSTQTGDCSEVEGAKFESEYENIAQ